MNVLDFNILNKTMKISVVIHTYNSEKFLKRVLDSVKLFDEIVLWDMHSTDNTIKIAEEYGCKIFECKKYSCVEPVRNVAIQSASNKWVLVVDSDEIIPEALRLYLYKQIKRKDCPKGILIPRKNYFMGKFMHGSYPDHIIRFLDKDKSYWPAAIQSIPIIKGKVETIPGVRKDLAIIHLINGSISLRLSKLNIYTDMEIVRRKDEKYSMFSLICKSFFRFFKPYILKGGFCDGKAGFINAAINSIYKFITISKLWENNLSETDMDNELKNSRNLN